MPDVPVESMTTVEPAPLTLSVPLAPDPGSPTRTSPPDGHEGSLGTAVHDPVGTAENIDGAGATTAADIGPGISRTRRDG